MPALKELSKEQIINSALELVKKEGWDALNARGLAKTLNVSTKPLYRIYNGMDEIKNDLYEEITKLYDNFITSRIDQQRALITLCIAYVEFAQAYKNLFISLFLKNNLKWQKIENVFDEKWNQSTIINLVNKHGYSFNDAKNLFLNLWLYANGLATLIATNEIIVDDKEILVRLVNLYKSLINTNNE